MNNSDLPDVCDTITEASIPQPTLPATGVLTGLPTSADTNLPSSSNIQGTVPSTRTQGSQSTGKAMMRMIDYGVLVGGVGAGVFVGI